MQDAKSILQMARGAFQERVDLEMAKVIDNILDPNIISTGSSGNAVVINNQILIDCGVPYKRLDPVVKGLKLVLLTHVHSDHFRPKTAAALNRERPSLRFGCCKWMVKPLLDAGVDKRVIDVMRPDVPGETSHALIYGGLTVVRPETLVHNVLNCGWHIHCGTESLFYATDTGRPPQTSSTTTP